MSINLCLIAHISVDYPASVTIQKPVPKGFYSVVSEADETLSLPIQILIESPEKKTRFLL